MTLPHTLPPEYLKVMKTAVPRPTTWDGVMGNDTAKEIIREAIVASKLQDRAAPHCLLFGPPGVGKSTMSKLIAQDMGGGYVETTASTLETPADVIRILWELNDARERTGRPSVLFIDEIHRLGRARRGQGIDQEMLYTVLEDWQLHHNMAGKAFTTFRGERLTLLDSTLHAWPFTLVGSTTEPGMLSQPLLRRFLLQVELQPYTEGDITEIIKGAAGMLEWPIEPEASAELCDVFTAESWSRLRAPHSGPKSGRGDRQGHDNGRGSPRDRRPAESLPHGAHRRRRADFKGPLRPAEGGRSGRDLPGGGDLAVPVLRDGRAVPPAPELRRDPDPANDPPRGLGLPGPDRDHRQVAVRGSSGAEQHCTVARVLGLGDPAGVHRARPAGRRTAGMNGFTGARVPDRFEVRYRMAARSA